MFFLNRKVCLSGACVAVNWASNSSCLYENEMLTSNSIGTFAAPSALMTCDSIIAYANSINVSPKTLCLDSIVAVSCCKACASYLVYIFL